MPGRPILLVHGYSDQGASFLPWKAALVAMGCDEAQVHILEYRSLTNEVTIKDLAEGFDRALRTLPGFDATTEFDAIVHSTGMLVLRSWLSTRVGNRAGRLKHLVALAPATHGSPLARTGRGFLGAVFKGSRVVGPDFMEAGDAILDGLELASRFTWDLTHADLLCDRPVFRSGEDSPWVFILCGDRAYDGLRRAVNDPGSDGTVRWAGCSLDTQKITIDLSRDGAEAAARAGRIGATNTAARDALPMPVHLVEGLNHATIVSDPTDALRDLVWRALHVGTRLEFDAWRSAAAQATAAAHARTRKWQQFIVRVMDERDDPVTDWFLELFTRNGPLRERVEFDMNVQPYSADTSRRCFHVCLCDLTDQFPGGQVPDLHMRLIASSGSELVGYHGLNSERVDAALGAMNRDGIWDAEINLPMTFGEAGMPLFQPFTTTFVEIRINRDPMPFGQVANKVCYAWTGG